MELAEIWLKIKPAFENLVQYGFPTIAIVLSIISFIDSKKASKIQDRLNEVEEKLKRYELEEKEKEREEANKANVEARIVNISKGKYRMKIWNSGKATAYNVNFTIPKEYSVLVMKDKVPYEFLESNKNFEEHVIVHYGTSEKFKVITTWTDEQGVEYSREQMTSI